MFIRGGKYSEEDAKEVMVQILSVVAFCHLQGVVHRDLKPEVICLIEEYQTFTFRFRWLCRIVDIFIILPYLEVTQLSF